MHYFKFNIGDYHKKAGRLTMIEHGAYTLLLHACYDRECFPTKEEAIDWCWARTADEVAAVEFVLGKFFRLEDGRYVQDRIMEEIDAYHEKAEKNRHIALEREEKRRTKRARNVHDTSPKTHEPPPNQEPRNQEPRNQEPILSSDTDVSESSAPTPKKKQGSEDDHKAAHWMFEREQQAARHRLADDVTKVFSYWQSVMGARRAVLDQKRTKVIQAMLKAGYSSDDLCKAIRGCSKSAFHMGQNDNGAKYNGLDLICRNAEYVDRFMAYDDNPPKQHGKQARIESINRAAVDEFLNEPSNIFGPDISGQIIDGEVIHG